MVVDRDDVPALPRDEVEEVRELARPVGDQRADGQIAARAREPVLEHGDQRRRVDVPAGEHDRDRPRASGAPGQEGRDPDRARALHEQLLPLEAEEERVRDLLVSDLHDVVEQCGRGSPTRARPVLHRDAVGDRHARPADHAHDADTRRRSRSAVEIPAASPPPPIGTRNVSASSALLRELEPDRALPRDHARVLERVHERRAGTLGVTLRGGDGVLERLSRELDGAVVGARRLDLGHRRVTRHVDRRADPRLPRRPGDRLAVVPGARGDDARRTLARGRAARSCCRRRGS